MNRKIRILMQETSGAAAANIGGPAYTTYVTFDVEAPELVARMEAPWDQYGGRSIIGVEILPDDKSE